MKISELIEKLEKIKDEDGDIDVLVDGYESGYIEPSFIHVKSLIYNYHNHNQWYYGRHEDVNSAVLKPEKAEIKKTVCINRKIYMD